MNRKAVAAKKSSSIANPLLLGGLGSFIGAAAGSVLTLYATGMVSVNDQIDNNTAILT